MSGLDFAHASDESVSVRFAHVRSVFFAHVIQHFLAWCGPYISHHEIMLIKF